MLVALVAYLFSSRTLGSPASRSGRIRGNHPDFAGILGRILATISIGGHKDGTS